MNPNHVDKRLRPVLGEDKAEIITALACGAEDQLEANPVFKYVLPQHLFLVFAVMYGTALRIATKQIQPGSEEKAAATLDLMNQIVAAMQTDLPDEEPDAANLDRMLQEAIARAKASGARES